MRRNVNGILYLLMLRTILPIELIKTKIALISYLFKVFMILVDHTFIFIIQNIKITQIILRSSNQIVFIYLRYFANKYM